MFLIRDQNFVAGLQVQTCSDEAHCLGRIVSERKLVLRTAEEFSHLRPLRLESFVSPSGILIRHERSRVGEIIRDSLNHWFGSDTETAVVEKDAPFGQRKLLAPNALPISFRVFGCKRA